MASSGAESRALAHFPESGSDSGVPGKAGAGRDSNVELRVTGDDAVFDRYSVGRRLVDADAIVGDGAVVDGRCDCKGHLNSRRIPRNGAVVDRQRATADRADAVPQRVAGSAHQRPAC